MNGELVNPTGEPITPATTDAPSGDMDGVVLSFSTAWICGIAFWRELLPAHAFTKVRFGEGTIPALCVPDGRKSELKHRGLFAWLSCDAPRLLQRRHTDMGVLLLIWKERNTRSDEDDWNLLYAGLDSDKDSGGSASESDEGKKYVEEVVVEAYEMRCTRWGGDEWNGERMQAETAQILRAMSGYMICLAGLEGGFRVDIEVFRGMEEEEEAKGKLKGMNRIQFGRLRAGDCEIVCATLVAKDV